MPPLPPRAEHHLGQIKPIPRLSLGSHLAAHYQPGNQRMAREYQHRAGLSFRYADAILHGKRDSEPVRHLRDEEVIIINRQPQAEHAFRQRLEQLGFSRSLRQSLALPKDSAEMYQLANDDGWLRFVQQVLPTLRDEGWEIEITPGFLFDLTSVDAWFATLDEAEDHSWFDLELGIVVDGQRVSLLPVLLKIIRQSPDLLSPKALNQHEDHDQLRVQLDQLRRDDGLPLQVALPYGRLKPILTTLGELYLSDQPIEPQLRLARSDAARLGGLSDLPLTWHGGEQLLSFADRLRNLHTTTVDAPIGLQAQLRPYQLHGLSWLQTLRELGTGGILGDDMGLGKTLQSLAHLLLEKQAGRLDRPALVIMPTSLIPNWQDEAARFAPDLRVLVLQGPARRQLFPLLGDYDLVLTTYALLPRDIEALRDQSFHVLILDEAQNIKNPSSKAGHAIRELKARQRLCLTGTPLENHLGELWSLFDFLMPGWLGDAKRFAREYRTPIEKHADLQRLTHLKTRIKPFLLRRHKEDVARELPVKNEITHWVELSDAQRDVYETVRLAMDSKVRDEIDRKGLARSQIVILEALLKLRQVCCDLRLVKDAPATKIRSTNSGKLDSLLEILIRMIGEGRRVLLFSQFTSMLALIEQALDKHGIPYVILTGATRDRREPVERFQAGKVPVFLISLKAGGTGLNLTAADTVIHYDPWWNPAVENQATDRAYRIGQDKPVFVYKLITRGTVEERIQQLQWRKSELAAGVLEGTAEVDWEVQQSDIDALLAPLP